MQDLAEPGALILVVDDDARSRELMRIILRHAGYRVLAAPDPQAAIALMEPEPPAAALVDLLMPDMTGTEFCRWMRGRQELAAVKFMLLTGMDDEETRREASQAGADAVMTKPFDRLELLRKIATLLGRPDVAP